MRGGSYLRLSSGVRIPVFDYDGRVVSILLEATPAAEAGPRALRAGGGGGPRAHPVHQGLAVTAEPGGPLLFLVQVV